MWLHRSHTHEAGWPEELARRSPLEGGEQMSMCPHVISTMGCVASRNIKDQQEDACFQEGPTNGLHRAKVLTLGVHQNDLKGDSDPSVPD